MRVTIGDREFYLRPDELPAFSYSLLDLIDLSEVKGSFSTTLFIPTRLLGSQVMAEVANREPLPFRVSDGGISYFTGKASIVSASAEKTEIIVTGDGAAWKADAANLRLPDIDMGITAFDVTATIQRSTWEMNENALSEPLYFPLIDYGSLEGRASSYDVDPANLRPCLRAWHVIQKGLADLGYSARAQGLFETHRRNYILGCTTDRASSVSDGSEFFNLFISEGTSYVHVVNGLGDNPMTVINMPNYQGPGANYPSTGRYEPLISNPVEVSLRIRMKVDVFTGSTDPLPFRFILWDFTDNVEAASVDVLLYHYQLQNMLWPTFNFGTVDMTANHEYGFAIATDNGSEFYSFNSLNQAQVGGIRLYGGNAIISGFPEFANSNTLGRFKPGFVPYVIDKPFIRSTALPDITLWECIKWLATARNIVVTTEEDIKRVTFRYYDDFTQPESNAIDYTDRLDHTDPPKKVTEPFPKAYQFRWKEDARDKGVNLINSGRTDAGYGNADYQVDRGVLDPKKIEIGFAPTAMTNRLGTLYIPTFKLENGQTSGGFYPNEYNWEPRLLYAGGEVDGDWVHDGQNLPFYSNCYFISPFPGAQSLAFGEETANGVVVPGAITTRWLARLERSTEPILEGYLDVPDHFFIDYDPGRPLLIHDGHMAGYYYIHEVDRHQFFTDRTTKVRLIPL